jgi:hypothetical protein
MSTNGHCQSLEHTSSGHEQIRPVFSEDDDTNPSGICSWHDIMGASWLDEDLFMRSLLAPGPEPSAPDTIDEDQLIDILVGGENTIICSKICPSITNAINEFTGQFTQGGPPDSHGLITDYITRCHSEIWAVPDWSQRLRLGPDSSYYQFESLATCTHTKQMSVLVRAVPVQARIQVSYKISFAYKCKSAR